jgi:hypothetical protein
MPDSTSVVKTNYSKFFLHCPYCGLLGTVRVSIICCTHSEGQKEEVRFSGRFSCSCGKSFTVYSFIYDLHSDRHCKVALKNLIKNAIYAANSIKIREKGR